jgi:dihydrofolate reductase
MRQIVNSTFMSLDGIINHMDRWHFGFIDAESDAVAFEQLAAADALLMGRTTYKAYASVWPARDGAFADRINQMQKYVASSRLTAPSWSNTTVLDDELVGSVTKLKNQPGRNILMHGYGPVAKTLMAHGLIDELCLWVHPMLAGVGDVSDTLLSDGLNKRLDFVSAVPLASGVVLLTYRTS